MSQKEQIQLFEKKKVRTVWDDEREEWYFSVVDVVKVLADCANPTDYLHLPTAGLSCQKRRMNMRTNRL